MKVNVALVRCGQTERQVQGRCVGRSDEPISTAAGRLLTEKQKAGDYPPVELVYTGGMLRCVESARLAYPGQPVVVLADLLPFDYGVFEGRTMTELHADKQFNQWIEKSLTSQCPSGDVPLAFRERCCRRFRKIADEVIAKGMEAAAVVTHGEVIDAILRRMAIPRSSYRSWETAWGKGYWLEYDSSLHTIKLLAEI